MMKLLLLLSAFVVTSHASTGGNWNYHEPGRWPDICVHGNTGMQSPINVVATKTTNEVPSFNFDGYDHLKGKLFNTGSTVEVEIEHGEALLSGGDLPAVYKLAQFHWHWGSKDGEGSEHKLNGEFKSMEVHFVHYRTDLGSLSNAADKPKGLAVLSWLIEVNEGIDRVDNYMGLFQDSNIEEIDELDEISHGEVKLDALDARKYMGDTKGSFYRYDGGLTTPNCYESVIWTVFKEPILIGHDELDRLRHVQSKRAKHGDLASDNNRPPQNSEGRDITFYKKSTGSSSHGR